MPVEPQAAVGLSSLRSDFKRIKQFLDQKVAHYNQLTFIENDPIVIPHQYSNQADVEISGLFAALFAWGQRKTIIQKSQELMKRMDNAPHQFITQHEPEDLHALIGFKHRTFNDTDLLYLVAFLRDWFSQHRSLEKAFYLDNHEETFSMEHAIHAFHQRVFALEDSPRRTQKHVSSPASGSACKRINMYLRWMVRKDAAGVDFGIWKSIAMNQLICPLDVHVAKVARELGLLARTQNDWKAAQELTDVLKLFDPHDPVRYDFALFSLGVDPNKY